MQATPADRFVVETPENIRFGYDIADIGSRFLAIFIDTLIQSTIYILLFIAVAFLAAQLSDLPLPRPVNDFLAVVVILVLFLIQFGYFLFFEIILNGQTPGKRLFHLRVIKDNGQPLSALDTIIRNIVRIIDYFPFLYGVGLVTMFLNVRAKRLGDYAAGTIVVKMRDQIRLSDLQTAPTAPLPINLPIGIGRLDESDIALAESFLQRRANFVNREQLAVEIAQRLARKMGVDSNVANGDVAMRFIQDTVSAYRSPRG
ncbi:MAG TPA: RDD family protein [Anaerolineae bacterium]|nr:RDD family protein [Anaerolineae bacterium]